MTLRYARLSLIVFCIIALLAMTLPVTAQGGGQLCIEAFEDRNGNGSQDGGEPLLTRGVSANLLDAAGVIVESVLLDNSPTAGRGLVCFRDLAAGQYSIEVTSADYQATIPGALTVEVLAGQPPQVISYGGQRSVTDSGTTTPDGSGNTAADQEALVERAVVSGAGAAVTMLVTGFIGFVIYLITLRRRYQRLPPPPVYDPRRTTGSMRPIQPSDTGEYPRTRQ